MRGGGDGWVGGFDQVPRPRVAHQLEPVLVFLRHHLEEPLADINV